MKKIIFVLGLLIGLIGVQATNQGNISTNSSYLFNGTDMLLNSSGLFISGNLTVTSFITFSPRNCTNLTGNFVIKSLTIGREDKNFSVGNAIRMTSYDGDFNKLNSTYTDSWISYSKYILSEDFTNESICTKFYMGVLAEKNPEYRWYNFKKPVIFKPLVVYVCMRNLTQITYCE